MTGTVTRLPERGTRGREIRLRKIHEIAEELFGMEVANADADGQTIARTIREMASDRLRTLENGK